MEEIKKIVTEEILSIIKNRKDILNKVKESMTLIIKIDKEVTYFIVMKNFQVNPTMTIAINIGENYLNCEMKKYNKINANLETIFFDTSKNILDTFSKKLVLDKNANVKFDNMIFISNSKFYSIGKYMSKHIKDYFEGTKKELKILNE
ncbi:MAG: hypothetical protein K0R54_150 [Clostridiaceae bacterium]|jgi:hypothetical protein|nr:hypothetical protein [Clostridiaceae bacterium]